MRRLLRWAFNGSAVVSAALLVGVCVLWVRGYLCPDVLPFSRRGVLWQAESARGRLAVTNMPQRRAEAQRHYVDVTQLHRSLQRMEAEAVAGGRHDTQEERKTFERLEAVAAAPDYITLPRRHATPAAAVAFPLAVLPAAWLALFKARRRAARRRRGLCPACNYDLTGNISGVCSECGTAVE